MVHMQFYKIASDETVSDYLSDTITGHLAAGNKVLWLLSGGSAIKVEVTAARALRSGADFSRLTLSLFDERYGPPGHAESNWQQLADAGLELAGANLRPVLVGKDMAATAEDFAGFIDEALTQSDFSIGLAGIGPDGHTLGIKPGSPAVAARQPAIAYDWQDYRRLTTTASVISRLDEIVVYALGSEKLAQLEKLREDINPDTQPAQLLKLCPNLKIFSDQAISGP